MADVSSVVSGAREAVGRYFGVVSVLPSFLLVTYLTLLVRSGAWTGPPKWGNALAALSETKLVSVGFLVLASVALATVLHPLQFTLVQLLEGYWGVGRWIQQVRAALIARNVRRRDALLDATFLAVEESERLRNMDPNAGYLSPDVLRWASIKDEADRLSRRYPDNPELIMPSRLGNMLRRYEAGPGKPYGMDLPTVMPLLAAVAPPEDMAYVNDQRSSLDLSVRACMICLLATAATFAFLWNDGMWMLLALLPYAGTYLAYRGSVVSAEHYGIALLTLLTLNRFELYDRLRLERPRNLDHEVALNADLAAILVHFERPDRALRFVHPQDPAPPTTTPRRTGRRLTT